MPHEVVGMANYNKNIFVGTGGSEGINKSHFIGATYGLEKMIILRCRKPDAVAAGKSGHKPKNADIATYNNSTGFEAVVGYLYLSENWTRLEEILQISIKAINNVFEEVLN